jgi:hypothetical protein
LYQISFYVAERATDDVSQFWEQVDVTLGQGGNATTIGTVGMKSAPGSSYVLYTFYYTPTVSGPFTLKFVGSNSAPGSDRTAFIDAVQVLGATKTTLAHSRV